MKIILMIIMLIGMSTAVSANELIIKSSECVPQECVSQECIPAVVEIARYRFISMEVTDATVQLDSDPSVNVNTATITGNENTGVTVEVVIDGAEVVMDGE